jgi:hypothetical protein
MDVIILLLFVSLVFVLLAIGFFAWILRERSHEHADRLPLLPFDSSGKGNDPWNE